MRSQDILKLATDGRFDIYRINQAATDCFILKHMETDELPCWNIVAQANDIADLIVFCNQHHNPKTYPLVCSQTFSTMDLVELCKKGYSVLKETENDDCFCVEIYNQNELRWNIKESFCYMQERTAYMNSMLIDSRTITID